MSKLLIKDALDDEFINKWYSAYTDQLCTIDHIQRLYNIDKISEKDFFAITGSNPKPKEKPVRRIKELTDKISILEEENKLLKLELSITQDAVNELLFNALNA